MQRAFVRAVSSRQRGGEGGESSHELNVIPFLDIVTNVMMFLLATLAVTFTARIDVPVPGTGEAPPDPYALTVQITDRGYVVASPSGFLQPGCETLGPAAVTVPRRIGAYDTAALTSCLEHARNAPALRPYLTGQRSIQVAGGGDITYGTLTATVDAARGSRAGAGDLFPEVRFGMLM